MHSYTSTRIYKVLCVETFDFSENFKFDFFFVFVIRYMNIISRTAFDKTVLHFYRRDLLEISFL